MAKAAFNNLINFRARKMCFVTQYRSQSTGDNESKGRKKKGSKRGCEYDLSNFLICETYFVWLKSNLVISFPLATYLSSFKSFFCFVNNSWYIHAQMCNINRI